ncbi:MAG: hypothetical protein AAF941_03005 [Pseudomonadota bacterium]
MNLRLMIASALSGGLLITVPTSAQDTDPNAEAPPPAEVPPATIDTDGDGVMDAWDQRGDGQPDTWDTDGDGIPDAVDQDGDGQPDAPGTAPSETGPPEDEPATEATDPPTSE